MLTVPAVTPVNTPDAEPIVAIDGAPELHAPPAGTVLTVVDAPAQTNTDPIATGAGFIVTIRNTKHPEGSVYIMESVPGILPVTTPVADPTEAFALLALHVPPGARSASVVVVPGQTVATPVIVAGTAFTANSLPGVVLLKLLAVQVTVQR